MPTGLASGRDCDDMDETWHVAWAWGIRIARERESAMMGKSAPYAHEGQNTLGPRRDPISRDMRCYCVSLSQITCFNSADITLIEGE